MAGVEDNFNVHDTQTPQAIPVEIKSWVSFKRRLKKDSTHKRSRAGTT